MDEQERYVCDANSLINLYNHFGRDCVTRLRQSAKIKVFIPEGIARELYRGTDRLSKFIKKHEGHLVIPARRNRKIQNEVARMENLYGKSIMIGKQIHRGFWASQAGRKAADSQVVAVAKVYGFTAVSDDTAVKLACALENVPCIGWTEFARKLELAKQPSLF